jgi:hypothetical protein
MPFREMRNGFFVSQRLTTRQLSDNQQENLTFVKFAFQAQALLWRHPAGTNWH